ncbi:MAG: ABC transporter permease [Eubacteriales bacterium]|nr:ABC transporter permease [Eubacteriales bacterium]
MLENVRQAVRGIWSHKMRSFLTMLGIIIGIAAIIAIVSTIKGTSEQIKQDLIGSGNNTVSITLNNGDSAYESEGGSVSGTPILTDEIKSKVRKQEHIENATFFYFRTYTSNVYYQNKSFSGGSIYGIDENYLDTCGYQVRSGRGLIPRDFENFSKIALLDSNAAENLFGSENPVGKTIEIGKEPFIVVGVVTKSEDSMPTINTISEYDELYQTIMGSVLIPYKSWPISFNFDEPMNAIIKADSTDTMSSAGKAASNVMNEAIPSNDGQKSSFSYKADDILERVRNMQKLSTSTNQQLIWIASISLLVGGIGVMNIMLVSVTERTSEIGLKKAIGARKSSILGQFLTEAAVLTSTGGVIGVIAGIILSRVVSRVAGTPTAISIPAAVIAVVFSMLIGIVFGLLPSVKAANLNPIDALRSE